MNRKRNQQCKCCKDILTPDYATFHFGFIFGMTHTGGNDGSPVVGGHLEISLVQQRFVAAGFVDVSGPSNMS
jgi:hypothetical protein